jgi:hypothetical protein
MVSAFSPPPSKFALSSQSVAQSKVIELTTVVQQRLTTLTMTPKQRQAMLLNRKLPTVEAVRVVVGAPLPAFVAGMHAHVHISSA